MKATPRLDVEHAFRMLIFHAYQLATVFSIFLLKNTCTRPGSTTFMSIFPLGV